MNSIINSWITRYGADVFYNYSHKSDHVECILVVNYKDEIYTYVGKSKIFSKMNLKTKPDKIAKTMAQSVMLNDLILDQLENITEEREQLLDTFNAKDLDEIIENQDDDE